MRKHVSNTILGVVVALLVAGLCGSIAKLWGGLDRITTLEANDKNNHELINDIKSDTQEIRSDVKTILSRLPRDH